MALTDPEIAKIAGHLAQQIFNTPNVTAHSSTTALKAAVQAVDDLMNATTNQLQGVYPGTVVKLAIRDHARTGAPNLTNAEAAKVLALWAFNEVGLL